MLWAGLLIAGGLLAAVLLRKDDEPLVLGQQLANAQEAENARLAAGPTGPSPMPQGEYDAERGDFGLLTVTPLPFDSQVQ